MPVLRFTARGIAAIDAPESGRVEYWDEGMSGFGLRVSNSGIKTWMTMYRHKGRKRRHTLGTFPAMTLADAYEKARISLNEAANGEDPAGKKRSEYAAGTFGELSAEYLKIHAVKKKDKGKEDQRVLTYDLLPKWKNIRAKDITRRDVKQLLTMIVDRGSPIQANRTLALIRKMFNFAISEDIVEQNPCTAITLPSKEQSRDRVLTADEIRKVWNSADQDDILISSMIKLRILTAQRGGEIESMAWNEIDFETGWWTIPAEKAKNDHSHRVPLSPQAQKILHSLRSGKDSSPWVFPSPLVKGNHIENIQKAIQRVRARQGCAVDFVGHDLRRTAASHMTGMGITRLVVSKILNHVESDITSVYDRHGYDSEKRQALEAWGNRIDAILAGKLEGKVISHKKQSIQKLDSARA